ncbi:PREDICTED: putative F-box/LRR-repeat protein At5g41630 [Camelina sativa]|uniref:F-box/LRR-repeat protein At5g41630 n=1 Tax=Camelina sativa TaxID=90675 RepID=A0ABM0U6Y1_CAMSA|nr:PREDICTED: putative F-box/LRR-repeat protein At5g41630 [Camelina sativa]
MESENKDRISDLPDALICHILSFLPTKEAVSTSVLAKKWRPLFVDVPSLDIDDSNCRKPPMSYEEKRTNGASFMRFVDRVLALQGNAPIKRFQLVGSDVVSELWVLDWVPKVLRRGVSDIHLNMSSHWENFESPKFNPLPPEMFVSKTLVRLTIIFERGVNISVKGDVSLPKLKTLHLNYFKITTSMFNKLLSGCHSLEELVLTNLMWAKSLKHDVVFISIPTLKRLKFCRYEQYDDANKTVSLSFDNPNLVYMEYIDTIIDRYQQVSFGSLVEATIGLRLTPDESYFQWYECENYLKSSEKSNVTNFLNGILNVKILHLTPDMLQVLGCCRDTIPIFNNLTRLTIETKPETEVLWKPLPALLKSCPNLVTLVFKGLHHISTDRCKDEDGCLCKYFIEYTKVVDRTCLSSSPVKVIEILNFGEILDDNDDDDDDDDENGGLVHCLREKIEHVKYFLENMPNLEQVRMRFLSSNEEDVMMKVFKKLQNLPKVASPNCKIQVFSDNLSLSYYTSD